MSTRNDRDEIAGLKAAPVNGLIGLIGIAFRVTIIERRNTEGRSMPYWHSFTTSSGQPKAIALAHAEVEPYL